ncbi:hypothetical protein R1sor_002730 [Riccia sorocarpa]|uniref:Endoglucanase n=1 Tax=Riccia sorocarpa TaxID=122646 RepID=A0ABD3GZK3_9MARC
MYNKWGGPVVAINGNETDDDIRSNADMDRASVKSLEETQQSWLLGAGDQQKKKKGIDLGCMIISRRACCLLVCLVVFCGFISGLTVLLVKTLPKKDHGGPPVDNYTQALHLALRFFNAQKSGKLPKGNNVSWRGDSALKDGQNAIGAPATNLAGGYYDAGDNIKYTYTTAYTVTLLSWSVIEYRAKYQAAKEYDHVRELIKWGTEYLFKTFNYTNSNHTDVSYIYAQVGKGGNSTTPDDHYCWERPEKMDYARPAYALNDGCSDLAAEMAAAMAAASIVFKDQTKYSQKLENASVALLKLAEDHDKRGRFSEGLQDSGAGAPLYNSTGYWDEYLWSNAWVYFATGNNSYLKRATTEGLAINAGANGGGQFYGVFSWDNKLLGAQMLLTRLRLMQAPPYPYEDLLRQYQNQTSTVMCSFLPKYPTFKRTPGGMAMLNYGKPAPLQYVAGAAFLSALYADYLTTADVPGWACASEFHPRDELRNFSRSQIDYILGKNPAHLSYVVGFSKRYPIQVHHRAASIPNDKKNYGCKGGFHWRDINAPNKYVLNGAMVGGPSKNDKFVDKRNNFTFTEPTISGNAALVGALIALSEVTNQHGVDRNAIFSALPPLYVPSPPPPPPWTP